MWRTGLLYLDRGDSAIIAALRDAGYNTQQTPGSPTRRLSRASDTESVRENLRDARLKPDVLFQQGAQHWVVPADGSNLKFSQARPKSEDMSEFSSPTSDNTLFEEPLSFSLDQIKEDEASPDYFSYDGLEKSPVLKTDRDEAAPTQRRRARHPRAPSTPVTPTLTNLQRTRTLPARAKTNEGLLQLQATTTKADRPTTGHKRRISLGLPIRSPTAQAEEAQQSTPSPRVEPSTPVHLSRNISANSTSLIQQERELEYKHRHTYIGTASLDDFLEVLDVTPKHTTTKASVIKAFVILASSERLLARQASLAPTGWGLVARTKLETCDADYVEQAQAKLGSIVLRQFLDLIPFDEDEEAGAMSVVEAFSAASHLDSKAGMGILSKAKAFRSWMVRQAV